MRIAEELPKNLSKIAEGNAETEAEHDYIFAFRATKFCSQKNGVGNALPTGSESCGWVNKTMKQAIAHIALVVNDYDEAIKFYTEKLGSVLLDDTPQSETKRWVKVAPKGAEECCVLLAKSVGDEQRSRIGNQTGGRVFLFLRTDDFWRDYENYKAKGVKFVREPKAEDYGTVAVFEDLYGNLWDLVEFKEQI